ncbi:MAG: NADH:flavin oxidoreductase [Christensenellales bacterium]
MANLFSGLTIKNRRIKNRILFPAMVIFDAEINDGKVNELYLEFYKKRAEQDIGLIVSAAVCISPLGRLAKSQLGVWSDDQIEGLSRIPPICHRYGTPILMQIHHAGARAIPNESGYSLSSSDFLFDANCMPAKAMTITEIHELQQLFTDAALRAEKAGFDGIELHCAHNYLLSQFFSPKANRRTDCYGGSVQNRVRIATEIIAKIREKISDPDFIISCRLGCFEPTLEDSILICQELVKAGCDFLDISYGFFTQADIYTERAPKIPEHFPYSFITYGASQIKKHVNVPVATVWDIRTPKQANHIIEEGMADMVAVLRGLLADKEWTAKGKRGENVVSCAECKPRCFYFIDSKLCPRNK